MNDTVDLTQAKRAVLEKYLRGGRTEELAQSLRRQASGPLDSMSPFFVFHADGTKLPFFFLHGDYRDHPLWCLNVARDLDPEQPFYALEPDKLDSPVAPTLEAHAAAHLRLIRAIQPAGPYLLGGWCGGALLAFEMAHQLRAEGQTVDMLVLMEPPVIPAIVRLVRGLISRVGNTAGLGEDKQLDWFLRVLPVTQYVHRGLRHFYRRYVRHPHRQASSELARLGIAELGKGSAQLKRALQGHKPQLAPGDRRPARPREHYLDIFTWMAADYALRPYPGWATVFWSSEEFRGEFKATTTWCQVTQEMEVHVIAGTLTTCRTQHVHELAAHLRACLSHVQTVAERGDD